MKPGSTFYNDLQGDTGYVGADQSKGDYDPEDNDETEVNEMDLDRELAEIIARPREDQQRRSGSVKVYLTSAAPDDLKSISQDGTAWMVSENPFKIEFDGRDGTYDVEAAWIVTESKDDRRKDDERVAAQKRLEKQEKKYGKKGYTDADKRAELEMLRKKAFENAIEESNTIWDQYALLKSRLNTEKNENKLSEIKLALNKLESDYDASLINQLKDSRVDRIVRELSEMYIHCNVFTEYTHDQLAYDKERYDDPESAFLVFKDINIGIKNNRVTDKETVRNFLKDVYRSGDHMVGFKEFLKYLVDKGIRVNDRRESRKAGLEIVKEEFKKGDRHSYGSRYKSNNSHHWPFKSSKETYK